LVSHRAGPRPGAREARQRPPSEVGSQLKLGQNHEFECDHRHFREDGREPAQPFARTIPWAYVVHPFRNGRPQDQPDLYAGRKVEGPQGHQSQRNQVEPQLGCGGEESAPSGLQKWAQRVESHLDQGKRAVYDLHKRTLHLEPEERDEGHGQQVDKQVQHRF